MKYLILFALFLTACKKEKNTVTYVLSSGAGDVVVTDGELTIDFQACATGWTFSREARANTRYTIRCNVRKNGMVQLRYNGKVVAADSTFAVYKTP